MSGKSEVVIVDGGVVGYAVERELSRYQLNVAIPEGAAATGPPRTGGTYMLGIVFRESQRIVVGRLGERKFLAGFYLYVGSALGGLRGRINRHMRAKKLLHWHIDYLTVLNPVTSIWWAVSDERMECTWAKRVAQLPGASVPLPGFGASDCRCETHLVRLPGMPSASDMDSVAAHLHATETGFRSDQCAVRS